MEYRGQSFVFDTERCAINFGSIQDNFKAWLDKNFAMGGKKLQLNEKENKTIEQMYKTAIEIIDYYYTLEG